ncbi:hypothetical protein SAMN05444157_1514 [Frankineae bacterium MT45]|nr:hypothetical protein SAMN05444157_1514 [Frankineae bacterium MT45]
MTRVRSADLSSRSPIRRLLHVAIAMALLVGSAACGAADEAPSGSGAQATLEAGQVQFRTKLDQDRSSLVKAEVDYPPQVESGIGEAATFNLSMVVPRQLAIATPVRPTPSPSRTSPTLTSAPFFGGGIVDLNVISGDSGVTVVALSPEKQPLLDPGERATWSFSSTGTNPGDYRLAVQGTVLDQDSSTPLVQLEPISIDFKVDDNLGHKAAKTGNLVVKVALGITAVLTLAGLLGLTWRRTRGRHTAK